MRVAVWVAVGLVVGALAGAKPPLAPLVEGGEHIEEDVDALLTAASGATFEGAIAFSPDGKTLTSASPDHTVRLWDVATGQEVQTFAGHTALVLATAFSPDGRTLASASRDGTVFLWEVAGERGPRTLQGHGDQVNAVTFSPGGGILASASDDGTVILWDVASGRKRRTFEGHEGRVSAVAFSPDGNLLASASHDDKTVRLWDMTSLEELRALEGHDDAVLSVDFSSDGRTVASASLDTTVRLWDVKSGQEIRVLRGHSQGVHSVAVSPDGTTLASSSDDHTIRLWDVASGDGLKVLSGHEDTVNAVIFSPDGMMLASDSYDTTVRLWDVASGREIKTLPGHFDWILSVAFSPDGGTLASGSVNKTVSLWDLESGRMLHSLEGHEDEVRAVAFSPDGQILASASEDQTVRLWRVADGQEFRPPLQHRDEVRTLAFSPDGKLLATGSSDSVVRLWNLSSDSNVAITLPGHTERINAVAFSPDGSMLASASKDQNVRIWKVADHSWLQPDLGHGGEVRAVAFSPDGKSLVSGSSDSTVKIWELGPRGVVVGRDFQVLPGQRTVVASVSFSPDGKVLAAGCLDARVRLWDVATGQEIHTLERHLLGVQSLAFSPDGNFLASASTQIRIESPDEDYRASRIFAVGAEGSWIGCRIDTSVCLRHEVGNLLGRVGKNGRFQPILPRVGAERTQLELVEAPTELTTRNGGTTALRLKVRNNGSHRAFWVRAHRLGDPSLGHPLSISYPSPLGFLEPGEAAELTGWVSIHSSYKNPRPQSASFQLEITSVNAAPLAVPSIEVKSKVPWSGSMPLAFGLASVLLMASLYFSLTHHPLVRELSTHPQTLLGQSPARLPLARRLLSLTGRLGTVLAGAGVERAWLDDAIAFVEDPDPPSRCRRFAVRLGLAGDAPEELREELLRLKLGADFPLNLDRVLLHFPPPGRLADDVVKRLWATGETRDQITLILAATPSEQDALHRLVAADRGSLLVAPSGADLTELLLSATPTDVLARIIASQVRLTRISPYQTGGGVHRKALFFGRDGFLAHVLNREAANYLVVGGRQVGKSSFLKAIDRHFRDDPRVRCHFLSLAGTDVAAPLADALGLDRDTGLERVLEHLAGEDGSTLVLIDEADPFIRAESTCGFAVLKRFRSLSEAGCCHFILAGFWDLYAAAAFDYRSPVKNFGETLRIGALEADACRDLASRPMATLGLRWESDDLIERLVSASGRRANLIAIACNEILKGIGPRERVITAPVVDAALDSFAIDDALEGWRELGGDAEASRLDRIVVYATVERGGFTRRELDRIFKDHRYDPPDEQLRRSLRRLELAYVLGREGERYSYTVPLFVERVRADDPAERLANELNEAVQGQAS